MDKQTFLEIIFGQDSERDKQTEVGVSEIMGCRRRVWYRLNGTPAVNDDVKKLPAKMGTAFHRFIEREFDGHDPFFTRYMREVEVVGRGIKGHFDLFDIQDKELVDWKTSKLKNARYFPSQQQRTQVNIYALLLRDMGYDVETVTLVHIPRDGTEDDIIFHSEPFDESMAQRGLAWLTEVEIMTAAPEPEKSGKFCSDYCPYFGKGMCHGIRK